MTSDSIRLRELLVRLTEAEVRFVLVGGLAVNALGYLRLQGLPQVPSFAALDEKAKEVDVDGLVVRVCSLEHLLEMKRSSSRPRDREDLKALEAAQEPGEDRG